MFVASYFLKDFFKNYIPYCLFCNSVIETFFVFRSRDSEIIFFPGIPRNSGIDGEFKTHYKDISVKKPCAAQHLGAFNKNPIIFKVRSF